MVRVGESAGKLDEAFRALFSQIEFERDIEKRVKAAVRYPTFVLTAVVIGMTVLMAFVIPTFAATYKNLRVELPFVTQTLIAISSFIRSQWWLLILAGGAGFLVFKKWTETPRGRYLWDRSKAHMACLRCDVIETTSFCYVGTYRGARAACRHSSMDEPRSHPSTDGVFVTRPGSG